MPRYSTHCSYHLDLCIQRYFAIHINKHLPGPLRKIIQAYVAYEVLNNTTIRKAIIIWCSKGNKLQEYVVMTYGHISYWDVGDVTDMSELFYGLLSFNDNIGLWNVSKVTSMNGMFKRASCFNQSLASWNVSKVTTMNGMFKRASCFNQPLTS